MAKLMPMAPNPGTGTSWSRKHSVFVITMFLAGSINSTEWQKDDRVSGAYESKKTKFRLGLSCLS